ncbi:MAG: tetratricopeptide repeat protein [Xanthomonadales bacterium]|nr:tetratricopeptide repeat protein [Gammaproteobacteria bacterium]MBT8054072.1 tetratricopeptide repeat protein [Gammaproteobacteria bacterium]NND57397.1 tetratricopeptide repeat protein [Xanthomonadales bacterium]NNK50326.1 tetratricopeptide repeat protein [Xanthomonadales bacterium]
MTDIFSEFRERRVLPALGLYVGSCWVLIEILDRLAERYLWSPYITDAAFWGLYSLIPAVILMAWSHGKPGKDQVTTVEKVGVPINVIATLGLLVTVFGGKDLGATASMVSLANEEGVQETHYIPSESFRRRMAVFFFENESGDPELDWLQYGVTELLVQDLQQNPFVLATSPWANFGNGFFMRMKQAGFNDGLDVPVSLMRDIAGDANRQYFVEGSIDRADDDYVITVRAWETESLKKVAELTESGWDLYGTIDALSTDLRNALDVPKGNKRMVEDLPLAATYGESTAALRDYISGLNARLFENDLEASNAFFDDAVAADSGFVLAWFLKAINLVDLGDLPGAQQAISEAQQLDYRLPARDRANLKRVHYRLSGQQEKLIAFLRLQVRLQGDASSHNLLAATLLVTGKLEESREQYLAALEKDPLNVGIYLQLSLLERAMGDMESAIGYARQYEQERPEEYEGQLVLGDLLRDSGDLDASEEHYLQASLLGDQPVQPYLRLADLALRQGDVNEARELLEQADSVAQSVQQHSQVLGAVIALELRLGRIRTGIELLSGLEELLSQFMPPFQVSLSIHQPMIRAYNALGDPDRAQWVLEIAQGMVAPPLDKFLSFSEADILYHREDYEGAEAAVQRGVEIIEQFKLEDLKFLIDLMHGFIERKRGDYPKSADAFQATLERINRSVLGGSELYQELPRMNAELAHSLILGGELDRAEKALNEGFRLDPSEPMLWASKARYQLAAGQPQLAQASIAYALAFWKDADPEFHQLKEALSLEQEINGSLSGESNG